MRAIERINELLESRRLNKSQYFREIGISRSSFYTTLNSGGEIGTDFLLKSLEYFPDDNPFILGKENVLEDERKDYRQLKTIDEDPNGKDIPFVDGEFFATISPAMQDVITLKKDTFVRIPMFSRGEFAIQVTGNSMKGYINNGDWIIIRKLERLDKIIYGEVYVVVTKYDNHRTIKFIKEDQEDDSLLWLVPYNVEQFEPQTIEKEDVLEIYLVIGSFKKIGN